MKSDFDDVDVPRRTDTEGTFVFGYNGYIPFNIDCSAFLFCFWVYLL